MRGWGYIVSMSLSPFFEGSFISHFIGAKPLTQWGPQFIEVSLNMGLVQQWFSQAKSDYVCLSTRAGQPLYQLCRLIMDVIVHSRLWPFSSSWNLYFCWPLACCQWPNNLVCHLETRLAEKTALFEAVNYGNKLKLLMKLSGSLM